MPSRIRTSFVLLLLLVSTVAPAGVAVAAESPTETPSTASIDSALADTTTTASGGTIVRTTTFSLTPAEAGSVTATMTFDLPTNAAEVTVGPFPDGISIVDVRGFDREGDRYVWREGSGTPTLTLRFDLPTERLLTDDTGIDTGDWAYVRVPHVPTEWTYYGDAPSYRGVAEVDGDGVTQGEWAYLGATETTTRTVGGVNVRYVRAEGDTDAPSPDAVYPGWNWLASRLGTGGAEQVTVFALPTPEETETGQSTGLASDGNGAAYAFSRAPARGPEPVLFHEFVHLLQGPDTNREMEWYTEASAVYYARLAALNVGVSGYGTFRQASTVGNRTKVTFTRRSSWRSPTNYRQGPLALGVLDARIQAASDGDRRLADVHRRLQDEDRLTYDVFRAALVAAGNSTVGLEADRIVDGATRHEFLDDGVVYADQAGDRDFDDDGLDAAAEREHGTNPFHADTDSDGLEDSAELTRGSDPLVVDYDGDGDGLTDVREAELDIDPTDADTDGDGVTDGDEVEDGTDPGTVDIDTDGDGLDDVYERERGTDPNLTDTDGDGVTDSEELTRRLDPTSADTDADGIPDGEEVDGGTDPTVPDMDRDGLLDGEEIEIGTDPQNRDTDGDGLADGPERQRGLDPLRDDTDGDGVLGGSEHRDERGSTGEGVPTWSARGVGEMVGSLVEDVLELPRMVSDIVRLVGGESA